MLEKCILKTITRLVGASVVYCENGSERKGVVPQDVHASVSCSRMYSYLLSPTPRNIQLVSYVTQAQAPADKEILSEPDINGANDKYDHNPKVWTSIRSNEHKLLLEIAITTFEICQYSVHASVSTRTPSIVSVGSAAS